jgi:TolB-like protein
VAIFPVQNASGGKAPIRRIADSLESVLEDSLPMEGIAVVPRRDLDAALARERLRFTGGVDRRIARVLREELDADAVLIPTLELYSTESPPRVSLTVRVVSTGERPIVLWADEVSRSGDDAPGLLGIGLVNDPEKLERKVIAELARSVRRYLSTERGGDPCEEAGRFEPRRSFRAPELDDVGRQTVAVLPFTNETTRRSAGDVLVGQFVSQLARSRSFVVLDPGLVREELLAHRMVLENGVSVDQAMALLSELDADLVLSGYVQVYESRAGRGPPKIEFSAYVIDRSTAQLVWSSTSTGDGDAGVFFFGKGRVHTATELSCRMVRGVVDRMVGDRGALAREVLRPPQSVREARDGRSSRVPPDVAIRRKN